MPEPMNLPRGSIRALLAVLIVGAAVAMVFVPSVDEDAKSGVLVLAYAVIREYFGLRENQNAEDGPPLNKSYVG